MTIDDACVRPSRRGSRQVRPTDRLALAVISLAVAFTLSNDAAAALSS